MLQLLAPPTSGFSPQNVLRQLERIEKLSGQASGAYVVRDSKQQVCGTICVEHGRLCWAAAKGLASRLTARLCDLDVGDYRRSALHRLYRQCMDEQLPLGATLVQSRMVTEEAWRKALVQHTAESLLQLSPLLAVTPAWLQHDSGTYHSPLSLDGVEAAVCIGGLLHQGARERATQEFVQVLPPGVFAAAFVWPEREVDTFPVLATSNANRPVSTVLDLGRWGNHQLQLLHAVVERCRVVTGLAGGGHAIVCWNFEAGYCVALCADGTQMARLLSNLSRRGMK